MCLSNRSPPSGQLLHSTLPSNAFSFLVPSLLPPVLSRSPNSLPESRSLIHLDLTGNRGLDMAGIVALNAGLKKNGVMRCLDLDIPPGDEELSR